MLFKSMLQGILAGFVQFILGVAVELEWQRQWLLYMLWVGQVWQDVVEGGAGGAAEVLTMDGALSMAVT